MELSVGVLGLGDVGKAIKRLCAKRHKVYTRDLDKDELSGKKVDVLHICIPWSEKFENIVQKAITELKPNLVIINSTVKPGTTQALHQKITSESSSIKIHLVHAPIIGDHPHLYKYLTTFTKPIGATSNKAYLLAKDHFTRLGAKVTRFDSSLESELAKILSTTYYTWNILFEKWVHQLSQKTKANFEQVYTQWNQIYNQGYKKTKPNVIRPILKHHSGSIGGHCLIPNVEILDSWLDDAYTSFILSQNKKAE